MFTPPGKRITTGCSKHEKGGYSHRRGAVIEFITAVAEEADTISEWEARDQYGDLAPGEIHEDCAFTTLIAA